MNALACSGCGSAEDAAGGGFITNCGHVLCAQCFSRRGASERCVACGRERIKTLSKEATLAHSKYSTLIANPMALLAKAKEAHTFQSSNTDLALKALRRKNSDLTRCVQRIFRGCSRYY
jgi:hypothetical protein